MGRETPGTREAVSVASRVFTSAPIRVHTGLRGRDFQRADIIFEGVDQSGPSFEARVFLNNPDANHETEMTPENGYAGSFHVYGYGVWPGDLTADDSPPSDSRKPRAPITKYIVATDSLRTALAEGDNVTATVVLTFYGGSGTDLAVNLDMRQVSIIVDRPPRESEAPG